MKKITMLLVALSFLLCGCTGYKEIDRGYLVTAIGVGVKNGQAKVFVEAISSSDVISGESKRVILTGNGSNVDDAYNDLKASLVKPLYFEHLGTVVFEGEEKTVLTFLKEITKDNLGVYIVRTKDVNALFKTEMTNGLLGYDVITLIKTREKETDTKIKNQIYQVNKNDFVLPFVNFSDGKLVLNQEDDKK